LVRLRSASWVLGAQVASLFISFPMSIMLARYLGPTGKGHFALATLVASIATTIACVGLPSATTYYAARREASAPAALRTSLLLGLAALSVALMGVFIYASARPGEIARGTLGVIGIGTLAAPAALVSLFMGAFLIGVGRIRAASAVNVFSLLLQFGVCGVLAAMGRLTPEAAVVAWVCAVTASAVLASVMALRSSTGVTDTVRGFLRRGIKYGLASWIAGGLGLLVLRIDMILLAALKDAASVGVYTIAVTFAELLFYMPSAMVAVMVPKIAAEGQLADDLTARATRTLWPLTLIAGLVLASLASLVVPLLYGDRFAPSIPALWCLVPGTTFAAVAGPITAYFSGIGRPAEAVRANAANLAVNVVVNLLLIPRMGVVGAALASTTSYAVGATILILRFRSRTGVGAATVLVPRIEDVRSLLHAALDAVRRRAARGPAEEVV
jgi:O-antigen/teichoic acid export membrane protein